MEILLELFGDADSIGGKQKGHGCKTSCCFPRHVGTNQSCEGFYKIYKEAPSASFKNPILSTSESVLFGSFLLTTKLCAFFIFLTVFRVSFQQIHDMIDIIRTNGFVKDS